jgi:methionyl-tRNA synthetase
MLIHGTILDKNGKKMSKTEGNVIDPIEQIEKWGLDAVRYYALVGLNTYDNSSWDQDKLVEQFNSEICNDWGNLVSRVLHLIDTKLNGETDYPTEDFRSYIHESFNNAIYVSMDNYKIKDCFEKLNGLVKWANKYINDEKPWSLENPKEVLSNLYYLIVKVAGVYEWILPHRTDISEAIKHKKKVILFKKLEKADN